ncbi:Enoate reductase 1 [Yarrowia sp. B02]|nr:Enoate reductase 1 [Yarrowia sp. B02]
MPKLFSPIKLGSSQLQNRVVLAPLTRVRADPGHVPSKLAEEYYAQRSVAPGTLLISEATYISPGSAGAPIPGDGIVPGVWNEAQIAAWKRIIDKVHANGSKIFVQLWDIGRVAWAAKLQELGDYVPLGPSAVPQAGDEQAEGHLRALTEPEIKEKVALYAQAAKNAIAAGADGVEIHGATGYLPDTFLRSKSNLRTDSYGGSVENRSRFVLEVVDAVIEAVGPERTAIRLSPWSDFQDIYVDAKETPEQFAHLVGELQKRADNGKELAYLHLVEARANFFQTTFPEWQDNQQLRDLWKGNLIRAGGYTRESALEHAEKADNTLIAFGRQFISNPDLVEKLKQDLPLNAYDRNTFYVPGAKGYTDYPAHE